MIYEDVRSELALSRARSAWKKGVKLYALEMLENVYALAEEKGVPVCAPTLYRLALNGAESFAELSSSGSYLITDYGIAYRLCTPSELRKVEQGWRAPNAHETWIDVQARALWQAYCMVKGAMLDVERKRVSK